MGEVKEEPQSFDPFEPFRGMRDAYLDAMSKVMTEAVNSDSYAQAAGGMLEYYLTASAPFRDAIEHSMQQAIQQLSLPSVDDVNRLADRMTHVELRLDDMQAQLDRMEKLLNSVQENLSVQHKDGAEKAAAKPPVNRV